MNLKILKLAYLPGCILSIKYILLKFESRTALFCTLQQNVIIKFQKFNQPVLNCVQCRSEEVWDLLESV